MSTRALLAHPGARRYLAGQVLSMLGDSSMWLACGIWVKTLTGSNGAAGLTTFFFTAPALLAPLAGALVDRLPRRSLLIGANLAGVVVLVPLLAVRDAGDAWLVYLVMLMYGALNILIAPAQSALLAELLPESLRASANGLLRTSQESLRVLAPLAGAGLFALLGGVTVALIDMATFLAAAGFLALLRYPAPPVRRSPAASWLHELGAGLRFIAGHRLLRRVTAVTAVATAALGLGDSLTFAVVDAGLHRPPEFQGVLQMAQGLGAMAGGLVAATGIRRLGESRIAGAGMLLFGAGAALTATPLLAVVLSGRVLMGGGLTVAAIALLTLMQRLAPHHLQGRVFAGVEVATTVPQTIAIAVGAQLLSVLDYRLLLGTEAMLLGVAAALLFTDDGGQPTAAGTLSDDLPAAATDPDADELTARGSAAARTG
ncbi:MAG TPA: MFS transporter [Micromonosporaceae bacterium]